MEEQDSITARRNQLSQNFKLWVPLTSYYFLGVAAFFFALVWSLPSMLIFTPCILITYDLIAVILMIINSSESTLELLKKTEGNIFSILFGILLIARVYFDLNFPLLLVGVPLLLSLALSAVFRINCTIYLGLYISVFKIIIRVSKLIIFVMVSLKHEGILEISWHQVLFPIFVIALIWLIVSVACILVVVFKAIDYYKSRVSKSELIGYISIVSISILLSTQLVYLYFALKIQIEGYKGQYFVLPVIVYGVLGVSTFLLRNHLE